MTSYQTFQFYTLPLWSSVMEYSKAHTVALAGALAVLTSAQPARAAGIGFTVMNITFVLLSVCLGWQCPSDIAVCVIAHTHYVRQIDHAEQIGGRANPDLLA